MYGSAENEEGLRDAEELQEKTKQRLANIQGMLAETDEVASRTEEKLRDQTAQIKQIDENMGVLHSALDRSKALLNTFDRWAFRRTDEANVDREANEILQEAAQNPLEQQVLFEHQRYDPITRQWKEPFVLRDPAPFVYLDGKPATESLGGARWKIDFTEPDTDAEGWTYAFDFNKLKPGRSSSTHGLTHFVRRRKWKYQREEKSDVVDTISAKYKTGTARPVGLSSLAPEDANSQTAAVPGLRVRVGARMNTPQDAALTRTVFGRGRAMDTSGAGGYDSLTAHEKDRLARVENTDKEIDSAVDSISRMVDGLEARARNMNEEVKAQNTSVAGMENKMDTAAFKLAQVNARVRTNVRS